MRRAALIFYLVLFCGSAAADWTLVGGNEKIFTAYADKASISRTGETARMWGLYDFLIADFTVTGLPHESTVVLREYDCHEARVRLLAFVDYAGHMGAGKAVSAPESGEPGRWEPVVPGAVDEAFWKLACAK